MKKQRKNRSSLSESDMGVLYQLDRILGTERQIEQRYALPFRAPAKVLTSLQQCIHCDKDIALLIFGDEASDAAGLEAYARLMAEPIKNTNLPTYIITPPADPSSLENPSLMLKVYPVQEDPLQIIPDEWLSLIRKISDAHCNLLQMHNLFKNREIIMADVTQPGVRQTALNLNGGQFDEAAHRSELIAAGLLAEDAAIVAAKMTNTRRDALNANDYLLNLIASAVGKAEAKQIAAGAARVLATPEPKNVSSQRVDGFQLSAGILSASGLPDAKKAAVPASMSTRTEEIRAKRRKLVEALARPGETFEQAERRYLHENDHPTEASNRGKNPAASSLLRKPPEGDAQADFFVPLLYDVATKDSRSIMDVAVFRLSKDKKRPNETIRYMRPDGYVEVVSGEAGMASVWDYDIVLMAISHLTDAMNLYRQGRGEKPSRTFRPHVSEILKFCRRGDGTRQYEEIEGALKRLSTTFVEVVTTTQIKGKRALRTAEGVGLISGYKTVSYADNGRLTSVSIEVPQWLYNEVVEVKTPSVLTVHPEYFLILPGIGRFLYRLARRAAGKARAKWTFRLIYERSGSVGTFKEFCRILRKLIASNDLPEYTLAELPGKVGPLLVITHRDASLDELPELPDEEAEGDGVNDDAGLPSA